MKWLAIIGGVVVLIVVLCCVGFIGLSAIGGNFNANITPLPAGEIPARPPTPATAAQSGAEKAYLDRIRPILVRQQAALDDMSRLLANPQVNNPVWKASVTTALTTMRGNYREIRTIESPSSMEAARAKVVEAFDRYDQGANLTQQGMDRLETAYIDQAKLEFQAANRSIDEATAMLSKITPGPR